MQKSIKKYFLTAFICSNFSVNAAPLNEKNYAEIVLAYEQNQALFEIKFQGKQFRSVAEYQTMSKWDGASPEYYVYAKIDGGWVQCVIEKPNKNQLRDLAELKEGEILSISGSIFLISGDNRIKFLALTPCRYSRVKR
jgi:hypothetical protein